MDRRWIRIDQSHRSFDCSSTEFETLLEEARSVAHARVDSQERQQSEDPAAPMLPAEYFQLVEEINAELAELAALQRRDRFVKAEYERSARIAIETESGNLKAKLHAASLRQDDG